MLCAMSCYLKRISSIIILGDGDRMVKVSHYGSKGVSLSFVLDWYQKPYTMLPRLQVRTDSLRLQSQKWLNAILIMAFLYMLLAAETGAFEPLQASGTSGLWWTSDQHNFCNIRSGKGINLFFVLPFSSKEVCVCVCVCNSQLSPLKHPNLLNAALLPGSRKGFSV